MALPLYNAGSVISRGVLCLLLFFPLLCAAFQPDAAMLRKLFEDNVARCGKEFGADDPRTAQAARDLGFFLKNAGNNQAAAAAFQRALQIDEKNLGPHAPKTLAGVITLASVSPPREAEVLFRKALTSPGMNSALAAPALAALGDLRFQAKDPAGAAAAWRFALQHAELAQGKESDAVAKILNSLSQVTEPNESVLLLERARDIAQKNFGPNHPETATCEINLANALLKVGRTAGAAQHAQTGLTAFEASLGPRHPRVSIALTTLARAQAEKKSAAALYRRAVEIDRQSLGEKDPQTLADTLALKALLP